MTLTINDTFNILRNHKYKLIIELMPSNDEELDIILDGMRTTLDKEPTYADTGEAIYYSLTLEELVSEIFCLGTVFSDIEREHDIVCPFDYRVERI